MTLKEFFTAHPKAALGFSGGVDSAFLLAAAIRAGAQVRPYFVKTPFQPAFELEDARRLCEELGVRLSVIELDVLAVKEVAANPQNRCYYCKRTLFSALRDRAAAEGFELLLDGTNASDDAADRPGMSALKELQVRSPLQECGLTKGEIRRLSKELGLFTHDKPAYACLATRIPAGTAITKADLSRIEAAEGMLHTLGFRDFRVRLLGNAAKIQVKPTQFPLVLEKREEIEKQLAALFDSVLLDLRGR